MCIRDRSNSWHRYGARGITVCERWRNSFDAFVEDIGPRPSPKHSVDRIGGTKNYEPDNCKWSNPTEQARNMASNHHVTINGVNMTIAEAAEDAGLKYLTVFMRLKRGATPEEAIAPVLSLQERSRRSTRNRQRKEDGTFA